MDVYSKPLMLVWPISSVGESMIPKKKRKRRNMYKSANPDAWPWKVATTKLHEGALHFFEQYSTTKLNVAYIKRGLDGIARLKKHFHQLFWTTMREDE